jgi:hypothetical protein
MRRATVNRMKLATYGSGGTINFVWHALEDGRQVAAGRSVKIHEARRHFETSKDCEHLRKRGWRFIILNTLPCAVANIKRVDDHTIMYEGERLTYMIDESKRFSDGSIGYHNICIEFYSKPLGRWCELQNISMKTAILHFINNEKALMNS